MGITNILRQSELKNELLFKGRKEEFGQNVSYEMKQNKVDRGTATGIVKDKLKDDKEYYNKLRKCGKL